MRRVLVTGGAGFIGTHVCQRLLDEGDAVTILDAFDAFYDPAIKRRNVEGLRGQGGDRCRLVEGDVRDVAHCEDALHGADVVVHLAALAGVRPSLHAPARYMDVNVRGTQVLLEAMQTTCPGAPLVFGSSSSVYGGNEKVPFAEDDPVDRPVSPYAASKRAGELISFTFHHLTETPVTCLRFFTVYGPGQRPEMAIHGFCRRIMAGKPLPFFGDGSSRRDYTFVSDIVAGVLAATRRRAGFRIFNLGGAHTTTLAELVTTLEQVLGRQATLERKPAQPGDVAVTYADIRRARQELGFEPEVGIEEGLGRFAEWYLAGRREGLLR